MSKLSYEVLNTYIYEILKGTKYVALITVETSLVIKMLEKISKQKLSYFIQNVSENKTNIFFGRKNYIDVVKILITKPLEYLDCKEDFMLGILLGYGIDVQCERFMARYQRLDAS